ncbi:fatty acid CoA ligase family protein [Pseudobythopirellula maris]|nr:fatty acid CoA ligase family protein [Pseudobythopirellula maris]
MHPGEFTPEVRPSVSQDAAGPLPEAGPPRVNVADRLAETALRKPGEIALVAYDGRSRCDGRRVRRRAEEYTACGVRYSTITFGELDRQASLLAHGLVSMGVRPGTRIALLVKPGVEFVALVFALLRSGATMVLVDAGLGKRNVVRCLASTEPEGFVAIPAGQLLRSVFKKRFEKAWLNVTVGAPLGLGLGGVSLGTLRHFGETSAPSPLGAARPGGAIALPNTAASDTAAIVFTSGSTGAPKGVLYRHETFTTQADEIQRQYQLGATEGDEENAAKPVDLSCFPLFGLFNVASGVTTVLPEMDFSRPASCDPSKVIAAANDWRATQAFASPSVWDRLSRHAEECGLREDGEFSQIPTLRKAFSCGAPVPARTIRRVLGKLALDAVLHTPYGATEALPLSTISSTEILGETADKTDRGVGVCVGRRFPSIEWRVIRLSDTPLATIGETAALPPGEIGELMVRGPQVSRGYVGDDSYRHNALALVHDGETVWRRMGDLGYLDGPPDSPNTRFWFCGRKSHRVVTAEGTLYTVPTESVFNTAPMVGRTALVGLGPLGEQTPVLVYEPVGLKSALTKKDYKTLDALYEAIEESLRNLVRANPHLDGIRHFLRCDALPVDIRHNSKIFREKLAVWAKRQLRGKL